ncbi:MAG: VOC family protein [Deltaproteobacteria bacterium]|nr:VOC family protein [Deltaproteobacteria bacterium]
MSKRFGPIVQQGYVVPDIDAAMRHWLARGVGPFFLEHLRGMDAVVDGARVKTELKAAFAYSGDQQIEVIQPLGTTPTIYSEYLAAHPEGGLQHLAFWCDDVAAKVAALEASGSFRLRQAYGDAHAYLDSTEQPGVMIQLMARTAGMDGLFAIIRTAAEGWDGATDPVRKIDWSSSAPVIRSA